MTIPTASEKSLKGQTNVPAAPAPAKSSSGLSMKALPRLALGAALAIGYLGYNGTPSFIAERLSVDTTKGLCPAQGTAINVGKDWNPSESKGYPDLAADRLSRAVQIDTTSFDDMGPVETDPRWAGHYKFAEFLEKEFPSIFSTLEHEMVNTHGHLFTWKGSNESLKPLLLMGHIDVVPVAAPTVSQWTHPPFAGFISHDEKDHPGAWIWGRGSSDCKNSVMGIFGAVEQLIKEGFQPTRTLLIANGFDEEIGGPRGARCLAKRIEEKYGQDSVAFIVDEGFSGINEQFGSTFASFGMAEKGAVSIEIRVETPGGHSSVPPPHTGIGYLSLAISMLESNPFVPTLTAESPILQYLQCAADHANKVPKVLRKMIKTPSSWPLLAKHLAKDPLMRVFVATTQAVDLIHGGAKVNALPEVATAVVNHRIAFTSTIEETQNHTLSLLRPFAKEHGFELVEFDDAQASIAPSSKRIVVSIFGDQVTVAPITPSNTPSFALMAGTSKHVFGEHVIAAPIGMFANTDTKHFWNLTGNIYRFTPAKLTENLNQHTVNERISLNGHLTTTRFFYKLIQNADQREA